MLVAALIIGSVHLSNNRVKADEEPFSQEYKEDKDANLKIGATLTSSETSAKDVNVVFNYDNTGKGNYSEGTPAQDAKTAEIILIIDTSNSMNDRDIVTAKNAAVGFADLLSANKENATLVKLAVLTFNGDTNGRKSVNVVSQLTDSKTALVNAINTEYNKEDHGAFKQNNGTMTQDALKTAASMYSASGVTNKIIVLMSDGKPNTGKDTTDDGKSDFDSDVDGTVNYANSIKNAITIMTISYGAANNDVLGKIASGSNYTFTAAAGATSELEKAFQEAKEAVEGTLQSTTYAENVKMTVTLVAENFLFEDGSSVQEYTPDTNGNFPEPKLVVQKGAEALKNQYGIVDGKISVPAIKSVVLTYTFDEDNRTLEFFNLNVDVAVTYWTVNYYVEVKDSEENDKIFKTEYPYTFFGEQPKITEDSSFAVLTAAGYNSKYYYYDGQEVNEKENVIDVYFKLDPTYWSAEYYVDEVFAGFDEVIAITYGSDSENFELKKEDVKAVNKLPEYEEVDKDAYTVEILAPVEDAPYTWTVKYTSKPDQDWKVIYYIDGEEVKTIDDIKTAWDETYELKEILKVSELVDGKNDKDYKEADVQKDGNTYNVYYVAKDKIQATVIYKVDGETVSTENYVTLEGEEPFKLTEIKKVSELDKKYVDDDYKEAVVEYNEKTNTWVVSYDKKTSTVKFIVEGNEVYNKTATVGTLIEKPVDPTKEADAEKTYSFKGWKLEGKEVVEKVADKFEEADLTYYAVFDATPIEKEEDPTPTPEQKKNDPPIIYYVADPTPVPTADPTPVPTADPTPEPTQVPEEIEEAPEVPENVEVEIPETPEGEPEEIEIPAEPETPEGTPDDIEVELPDVPEGLPQTGTAPVAVFFGIGAACIILGGAMIVKIRRREEEM